MRLGARSEFSFRMDNMLSSSPPSMQNSALESARIGTWDLNLSTQERLLNTRAAAMLGYREDELEHSQLVWMDLVHPHDRMAIERASSRYRDRDKIGRAHV